jgi:hypothetical protein
MQTATQRPARGGHRTAVVVHARLQNGVRPVVPGPLASPERKRSFTCFLFFFLFCMLCLLIINFFSPNFSPLLFRWLFFSVLLCYAANIFDLTLASSGLSVRVAPRRPLLRPHTQAADQGLMDCIFFVDGLPDHLFSALMATICSMTDFSCIHFLQPAKAQRP